MKDVLRDVLRAVLRDVLRAVLPIRVVHTAHKCVHEYVNVYIFRNDLVNRPPNIFIAN